LKLGRRSETGREKRVTPEFGERKEEKILPPNSGRYSFSPQSIGTLSPHKDHHTIGVSCFDYKDVENKRWGRRKAIQAQELKEHRQNSLF
jgi:hypothetical protein